MSALRKHHPLQAEAQFQWRGQAPNRLEALSDIVFGFAVTLLVVSSAPPASFAELQTALLGFPGFLAAFAMLLLIWHAHYLFFRRYGIEDSWTMALNALLLFLVLLFVYPLKFIAGIFSAWVGAIFGLPVEGAGDLTIADGAAALSIFAGFYVAVFLALALLYARALTAASGLGLNAAERRATLASLCEHLVHAGVGGMALALTWTLPVAHKPFAGFAFFLIGPLIALLYAALKSPPESKKETA